MPYLPVARQKNTVDSVQLTLSVTPAVRDFLEQLSRTGFFGKNAADTACELLKEQIRVLMNRPGTPGIAAAAPGQFPAGSPASACL